MPRRHVYPYRVHLTLRADLAAPNAKHADEQIRTTLAHLMMSAPQIAGGARLTVESACSAKIATSPRARRA
jgi:hypothetical protein